MGLIKPKNRLIDHGTFYDTSEDSSEDFFFIQAADTQLGMMSNWDTDTKSTKTDQYAKGLITWEKEIELCRKMVKVANAMSPLPEFIVICGDLLDAFPEKWPDVRNEQEKDFKAIFRESKVPVICVCGNHDVGDAPTTNSIQLYKKSFGDDFFSFWVKGIKFLVLNSQLFENIDSCKEEAEEHEKWLDDQLHYHSSNHKGKPLVVFQHIPWFINEPDEEKIYFNVSLPLRERMLEKFHSSGVSTIFCGHYHRNAGGFYKEMELVVTSAVGCQIGNDGHGFRNVHVSNSGKISHEYKTLDSYS
ncbi:serine/threonine-protein phosphatase CPPED1 [Lepeophtheirus salmonis]|uniref:serine/threonine-protein phosphatase CPPED1 n=1 Tax=Lepeophtheirus salmonis TaxID=72036 RepID=UPI001AE35C29|nr:serine/threonine-protein phosphatase CPPED1-like [Lepeophtheirus salmonis]